MTEKHQLRKKLLAARKAMAPEEKAWRDKEIGERLLAWLEANPAECIGVYWPIQGEPDLTGVYPLLAERGIKLALPVVVERDAPLAFHAWGPGEVLMAGAHGVMAPVEGSTAVQPELLVVPCVGFNAEGYRLGYGGGYYDRSLARECAPRTIGIAYAMCEAAFAVNDHDAMMDVMITDAFILVDRSA
jgi:5-formyltetrahydrofolate cyclo-ligase